MARAWAWSPAGAASAGQAKCKEHGPWKEPQTQEQGGFAPVERWIWTALTLLTHVVMDRKNSDSVQGLPCSIRSCSLLQRETTSRKRKTASHGNATKRLQVFHAGGQFQLSSPLGLILVLAAWGGGSQTAARHMSSQSQGPCHRDGLAWAKLKRQCVCRALCAALFEDLVIVGLSLLSLLESNVGPPLV